MTHVNSLEDVKTIQAISSVPMIMKVISETTGLRFVCIARVTPDSWTTCAALDQLDFGLKPGDQLKLSTTLCNEVRASNTGIVIDDVNFDPAFHDHFIPKMYGFKSYFSIPIYRPNGDFFGTLCGLDPLPADLKTAKVRDMLTLFSELISHQLESEKKLASAEAALHCEREDGELREQFIAVLGHDLRTPLSSILMVTESLTHPLDGNRAMSAFDHIERCARRISTIIDNVVDFTRGRQGSGLPVTLIATNTLEQRLQHVVAEVKNTYRECTIHEDISLDQTLVCDPDRIAQLLSNLLLNALIHGDSNYPVGVSAQCSDDNLTITVSNTGQPIPKHALSRLFQPFWRGTRRKASKGLGLGLYIASEIALSHNGAIKVRSTNNLTTFTFSANLAQREVSNPAGPSTGQQCKENQAAPEPEATQGAGGLTDVDRRVVRKRQTNAHRAHRRL